MKPKEIRRGGLYVGKSAFSVREVLDIADGLAEYRDYDLRNGKYFGTGACSVTSLARWTSREATLDETARLQRTAATEKESARTEFAVRAYLMAAPDDWIINEVRRRGLTIPNEDAKLKRRK